MIVNCKCSRCGDELSRSVDHVSEIPEEWIPDGWWTLTTWKWRNDGSYSSWKDSGHDDLMLCPICGQYVAETATQGGV